MRSQAVVALLVLLPLVVPLVEGESAALEARGPDEDGAWSLAFEVVRAAPGSVALSLDVVREGGEEVTTGSRSLGLRDLPAGASRVDVAFLPAEGAGEYRVRLIVDGVPGEALRFWVDDAAESATLAFEVEDEPTSLVLTSDGVNAANRSKAPGDPLFTRARLSDANGLADVDGVRWRVLRGDAVVAAGVASLSPTSATEAEVEARFDRAPFPAGAYALALDAVRGDATLVTVSRTFVLREVATTVAPFALAAVVPDVASEQRVDVVALDRNAAPASLEARVYRGSARVESHGFGASVGAPSALADADGAARASFPLSLRVPAQAAPGSYRVSLYADGALAGSAPFEVRSLPSLGSVRANASATGLVLEASGSGAGWARAELRDADGARIVVGGPFDAGASLSLAWPSRAASFSWNLSVWAREGGALLVSREGHVSRAGPDLRAEPLRAAGRLPGAWRVEASGWDLAGAEAEVSLVRWDGAPAEGLRASWRDGVVRVESSGAPAPGRYEARLRLTLPNGTPAEASWGFEAGAWARLRLGDAAVAGREARVPVVNEGGVEVRRIVVEVDGGASVSLEKGGARVAGSSQGARVVFRATLAPGESAVVVVALPEGPLRSGAHAARVRVLAVGGA